MKRHAVIAATITTLLGWSAAAVATPISGKFKTARQAALKRTFHNPAEIWSAGLKFMKASYIAKDAARLDASRAGRTRLALTSLVRYHEDSKRR